MSKHTLVLGASENEERYSNMAVKMLLQYQHSVTAVGRKKGTIQSTPIHEGMPMVNDVDTVTLYLNPINQKPYYQYILNLKPKRIIFNPGTENEELETLAQQQGIQTKEACNLVLLRTGQY